MKRLINYVGMHPGILTWPALFLVFIGFFSICVNPIITIMFFIMGGLVFAIEVVLYSKLGLIDGYSVLAALAAFGSAFYLFTTKM